MTQLTIDTDKIAKYILIIFAILGFIFVASYGMYAVAKITQPKQVQQVPVVQPTVIPTPTPVPTPAYPPMLTFTVLSTTVSNGHYQAYTTTGQTLYFADFQTWNSLWPQDTYLATITGSDGNAYDVSTVTLLNSYYDNYQQNQYSYQNYPYMQYRYIRHNNQVQYTTGIRIIDTGTLYRNGAR